MLVQDFHRPAKISCLSGGIPTRFNREKHYGHSSLHHPWGKDKAARLRGGRYRVGCDQDHVLFTLPLWHIGNEGQELV